ncbi:putative methanogenesis marker 16 metalloprotein [Methanofollis sp. W23]|uniref:methanogenesis marker 16 metalloprotein n=1 Tax=Methanofollis sp. W23 TaxID=2817849 RepID=UPI001AE7CD5F|nr:methanogenesis marker 16 metalloprotein [Methanofollis sp. W23]MBP2146925.1 putative methanogenesis marker 16 metalloprotein [Methanofollis sp. W23]
MKTIAEIRERIRGGTAVVLTAPEFKRRVRDGDHPAPEEVDVVTCGTCGVMSGTAALLSVQAAPPGTFGRAEAARLNGVPAYPGPCPNERLGLVDMIVYGTAHVGTRYGGGHLFADLAAGKEVHLEVEAGGRTYEADFTLDDCDTARLFTTRSAFRNYTAFVNRAVGAEKTIFSVTGLKGPCAEASISGCGEISPLENDPDLRVFGPGARVLVNGAPGMVMGEGTRSTPEKPNLSVFAGMKGMDPCTCGGFVTAAGPECITSIAAPIPVLDQASIDALSVLDEEVVLPVADITDRRPFARATYAEVWQGTDHEVTYRPAACLSCEPCTAAGICPTGAFMTGKGIDPCLCASCGACAMACTGRAVHADLGAIHPDGMTVPITMRQSDRKKAEELCVRLKDALLEGSFEL